jgi:two-component system, LytTR family, sensor kinase
MNKGIPYLKAIRMALITAPLFGLFGAAPVLEFNNIELNRITTGFLVITSVTLVIWAVNIGLLCLTNRFNFRGKDWVRYIASASACILIFLLASQLIPIKRAGMPIELTRDLPKDFLPRGFPKRLGILMPLIQAMSINLVIIVLLEMMLLRDKKRMIEEENAKLRMFNLEAKHSQLKQQLHPHFLFNSLSTLRSLIKRSPEQAEEYLEKLSELLRFSINSDSQTVIRLGEEIELTTNYLTMQQVRFGNALNFTINIPSDMRVNGKVPVYSIQLLVENAIKHNILTTAQPLYIVIKGDKKTRTITIENNLQSKLHVEDVSGVGLSNLAERYRLLNNEEISINKTSDKFIVTIKVLENESSNS